MTYTELSKSEDGTTFPVCPKLSLKAPSQTPVVLEKSADRFHMTIPKIGCSVGRFIGYFVFFSIFLPSLTFVTAALAEEDKIWYLGTAVAVIGMVFLPFGIIKKSYTQWTIVIEGGTLKIIETFRNQNKERTWPVDEIQKIEAHRRKPSNSDDDDEDVSATTVKPACLLIVMSENTPFLKRYIGLGDGHPGLDDDTFDWMAREIAQFTDNTVVIPTYSSFKNCC